jgi:D-alanyl-D-alanine carboxypeptidase
MLKYEDQIREIHKELGIPTDYGNSFGLSLQTEEVNLVEIGKDIFGRSQRLSIEASNLWAGMKEQAEKEGVLLEIVSAYRSVAKQERIIQQKLDEGQSISSILVVIAAPGYSEHHTGRALDITTPACNPLAESFELTEAFSWLSKNAKKHSFSLSYPKENSGGVLYEPWHWACRT